MRVPAGLQRREVEGSGLRRYAQQRESLLKNVQKTWHTVHNTLCACT